MPAGSQSGKCVLLGKLLLPTLPSCNFIPVLEPSIYTLTALLRVVPLATTFQTVFAGTVPIVKAAAATSVVDRYRTWLKSSVCAEAVLAEMISTAMRIVLKKSVLVFMGIDFCILLKDCKFNNTDVGSEWAIC